MVLQQLPSAMKKFRQFATFSFRRRLTAGETCTKMPESPSRDISSKRSAKKVCSRSRKSSPHLHCPSGNNLPHGGSNAFRRLVRWADTRYFTSATVFGHIAKSMRIINGQVFVPGMPRVRRRVEKCVKDLEKNPRTQDVLPRMDFTPRQARCLLRDFYFGRYGKWNADYMDLVRLTSIARGKVDPIARWSTIPACVPVCGERFIWDWRIPARWYRRHDAYDPSDR